MSYNVYSMIFFFCSVCCVQSVCLNLLFCVSVFETLCLNAKELSVFETLCLNAKELCCFSQSNSSRAKANKPSIGITSVRLPYVYFGFCK
jgi:hypothetical protein